MNQCIHDWNVVKLKQTLSCVHCVLYHSAWETIIEVTKEMMISGLLGSNVLLPVSTSLRLRVADEASPLYVKTAHQLLSEALPACHRVSWTSLGSLQSFCIWVVMFTHALYTCFHSQIKTHRDLPLVIRAASRPSWILYLKGNICQTNCCYCT